MDPTMTETFRKIATRLTMFRPQLDLTKYIKLGPHPSLRLHGEKAPIRDQLKKYGVAAARTTLDGVTFVPSDWEDLLVTLRKMLTLDGQQAFAEGKSPEKPAHWALDASMGATIGKGFREIWRPQLATRPLSMNDLPERRGGRGMRGVRGDRGEWSNAYGSQFGKDPQPLDITSLHFAVAPDRVNIHIDETGFVFEGVGGELAVGPNFGDHIVNELVWKTLLPLPSWLAERMDVIMPNSSNDFSRFGVSATLVKGKSYRVTATGTCGFHGGFDCAATLSISGTHTIFDSK
jgi:hypothetical protein